MKVGTFSALVALIIVFLAFFTWFPGELSFSELRSVDSNATPIVTFSEDKAIKGVEEKKQPSPLALTSIVLPGAISEGSEKRITVGSAQDARHDAWYRWSSGLSSLQHA